MGRKVIVEVVDRNPFGETVDERVFTDPSYSESFVPGYSDVRRDNEVLKAEGKTDEIKPLSHRFHWITAKNTGGGYDGGRKQFHWGTKKRYAFPTYDEVIRAGYDLRENKAITKGEDGRAYWGQNVLGWADAKVAAAHWQAVQNANSEQEAQAARRMDAAVETFNTSAVAQKTGMSASNFEIVEIPAKQSKK